MISRTDALIKFITMMRKYQEINNTKGECLVNSMYLYDFLIRNCPDVKPIFLAVIVEDCDRIRELIMRHIIHMVVIINIDGEEIILEPSLEIENIRNRTYIKTFKELNHSMKDNIQYKSDIEHRKSILKQFLKFKEYEKKLNNGEFVHNPKYYNGLADYVELNFKELIPVIKN